MRGPMKRQLTKKRFNVFDITISNFLGVKNPLKINDVKQKKAFVKTWFLIMNNHLLMQFVKNV
jgi:hypothetical protein